MEESRAVTIEDVGDLMSDLRRIAMNLLATERNGLSVQPSDLIQSALRRYRVSDQDWEEITWENRGHFFRCAATMMRRALIDHARRRSARPKLEGKELEELEFTSIQRILDYTPDDLLALDEALEWLKQEKEEIFSFIEYHYIFGFTTRELSQHFDTPERTVSRRIEVGKTLLRDKIRRILGQTGSNGNA